MTNSDKQNNLFAHVLLQNSVDKALNTKRYITQTSLERKIWNFDESFARCLGKLSGISKYFLSNTLSQE